MTYMAKYCVPLKKTRTGVRRQPYVRNDQSITMDNTAQLIQYAMPTVKMMKLNATMELISEDAKKQHFAGKREPIWTAMNALVFALQPVKQSNKWPTIQQFH